MHQRPRWWTRAFTCPPVRFCFAGSVVAVGLGLSASDLAAQIVRPAIGRYHSDRVEAGNAAKLQGRYLQRQATPRFEERQTHLGYEVRGETYVVMANTSRDDALAAAAAIEGTWNDTLRMADYWSEAHREPNFSVAAISVHIDKNPRRENQEGDLRFVDNRTHVYLNVAEGEPSVAEQLGNLRASTVHAFWRRAEYDRQLPTWVRSGLASYVATQQTIAAGDFVQPTPGTNYQVYDAYWQRERIARNELAPAAEADQQAAIRVRYLLEGDDARHAPAFFAALEQTLRDTPPPAPFGGSWPYQTNDQQFETAVDRFYAQVEGGLGQWLSNPQVDQPQIVPLEEQPLVTEQQQAMAFLLKLAHRQGDFSHNSIQPKIIGTDAPQPLAGDPQVLSMAQLWRDMASADTPLWATLDPRGNLLLSDQQDRLRELVRPHTGTYRSLRHHDHWAIETRVDRHTRLIAWLEENPDSPRQPLVKFEKIVDKSGL